MKLQTRLLIGVQCSADADATEKRDAIRELVNLAASGDDDANDALRTRCGLCYSCRHGNYDPCSIAPLAWCREDGVR